MGGYGDMIMTGHFISIYFRELTLFKYRFNVLQFTLYYIDIIINIQIKKTLFIYFLTFLD